MSGEENQVDNIKRDKEENLSTPHRESKDDPIQSHFFPQN